MSSAEEELEEVMTGEPAPSVKRAPSLLSEPAPIPLVLPSKGLLYGNDPDLQGIEKDGQIFIRPITLDDIELFMMPELRQQGNVIDALFNRIIKSNINPKKLLVSDRNFILIYARVKTYGAEYTFPLNCENCNSHLEKKVNLGDLDINYLDEIHGEYNDKGTLIKSSVDKIKEPFVCELSMTGVQVYFRLPRGLEESVKATERYQKKSSSKRVKKGTFKKGNQLIMTNDPSAFEEDLSDTKVIQEEDQTSTAEALAESILRIESPNTGDGEVFTDKDEIITVLKHLPAGDISELQQFMKQSDSGIDLDIKVKCPNCDHVNTVMLPFTESFFRREVRQR